MLYPIGNGADRDWCNSLSRRGTNMSFNEEFVQKAIERLKWSSKKDRAIRKFLRSRSFVLAGLLFRRFDNSSGAAAAQHPFPIFRPSTFSRGD